MQWVCLIGQWVCLTFLGRGSLLHFLDEQVKHLRLNELLDETSCAFGLNGFTEAPLGEGRRSVRSVSHHVFGKMADSFDEERQEGFRDDTVQFLQTSNTQSAVTSSHGSQNGS